MTRTRLLIVMACAVWTLQVFAADWPHFRGPAADGIAPDTGINKDWTQRPPKELWRVELGDKGYAGPSVAEGKVFIIDHEGSQDIVRAIDVETGQDIWRYAYEDADKEKYGFARSTPIFSEGKLYTLSRLGTFNCLDANTGQLLWSKHMLDDYSGQRPSWDYAWSPVIDGNKLIITPGGATNVFALDKVTGDTIWAGGSDDLPGYSTPTIATILGRKQYVVFTGVSVMGVDTESGELLWRHPWKTRHDVNAVMPVVIDNQIFLTSSYNVGCGLVEVTPEGPVERWRNKEIGGHFNTPVYYNGYLFGIGDPGNLVCLDRNTGEAMWRTPGFENGGVAAVDGAIIAFAGKDGDLVLVDATPDSYNELGRITPLGGQSWTAPIITDGKLIVRNKEAMVCLDLM